MAEIESQGEHDFSIKRKSDLNTQEENGDHLKKSQKLESLEANNELSDGNEKPQECGAVPKENHTSQAPKEDFFNVKQGLSCLVSEANKNQDRGCDDDGVEDDDGLGGLDHKGKGVMRDEKGKGKMIAEEDDSVDDDDDDDDNDDTDDDDSSDDGELSDVDSDLSDDPLAEVDLGNILPSRTRRRTSHPGVFIASEPGNAHGEDEDDESDDGKD